MNRETDAPGEIRTRLLSGTPVRDRRLDLAGVRTAVLEAGDGPSIILLHGPGEFAATWLPVIADLARTHRVIAPDLPGHGASLAPQRELDLGWMNRWLDSLITATCPSAPPALVGRVVGGAVAARFAAENPARVAHLVLVDSTGLAPFEPDARFGLALGRFLAGPTPSAYSRLMDFCAFDLDGAQRRLGSRWTPYAEYAVELAGTERAQAAVGGLIGLYAATPIPADQLAGIDVPTTLVWGRHDLATSLRVAQEASSRYGWPLHVIEAAGDDPALDQPEAFLDAVQQALATPDQRVRA